MRREANSTFSVLTLVCPACVVGLAFATRLIEDEKLAFQVIGVAGIVFTLFALAGLIIAFVRKETLRWVTIISPLLLLAMFGLGVSA